MLGQAGSCKLRMSAGPSKLAVKTAKKFKNNPRYGSSGTTSELTSSLSFTPIQLWGRMRRKRNPLERVRENSPIAPVMKVVRRIIRVERETNLAHAHSSKLGIY